MTIKKSPELFRPLVMFRLLLTLRCRRYVFTWSPSICDQVSVQDRQKMQNPKAKMDEIKTKFMDMLHKQVNS